LVELADDPKPTARQVSVHKGRAASIEPFALFIKPSRQPAHTSGACVACRIFLNTQSVKELPMVNPNKTSEMLECPIDQSRDIQYVAGPHTSLNSTSGSFDNQSEHGAYRVYCLDCQKNYQLNVMC
jgi:hypothetical protein